MKILMTADTIGGVWTYALELADALSHRGVEVVLASMGDRPRPHQRREAHAIDSLTLYESTYKLEWMSDPWADVQRAGEWLLYLERTVSPDVIHLNGYAHAGLPWRSPTVVVAHSCVLSWFRAVKNQPPPASWDRYARAVREGLHSADVVVAPTRSMLDSIVSNYGELARGMVIPNGRHLAAHPGSPKWPFVLSAGRLWDQAKNVGLLEQAAASISWPIWLAGQSAPPGSGDANPGNVNLLGHLSMSELTRWLNRAAIYALPARYEPFGLGALEAALCGCALVLGDIDSLREVWEDAGLYVSPDDSEQLANVLQSLIDDPQQRARLGHMARQRAMNYSPQRMAEAYIKLYAQLTTAGKSLREAACVS